MHRKSGNTGRAMSMPGGLALSAAVSLCISIAGIAVLSLLIAKERFLWENTGYAIMVLLLISSFAGTSTAISRIKRRKALVAVSSCVIYFLLLLLTATLLFGGKYEAVGVTGCVVLSGSVSALLLTGNSKPKNNHHRTQKRR